MVFKIKLTHKEAEQRGDRPQGWSMPIVGKPLAPRGESMFDEAHRKSQENYKASFTGFKGKSPLQLAPAPALTP